MWSQIKGSWVKPTKRLSSAARQAGCLWSWAPSDRYLVSALVVKRKLMPKTSLALSRFFCRSIALEMSYWPTGGVMHALRDGAKQTGEASETIVWVQQVMSDVSNWSERLLKNINVSYLYSLVFAASQNNNNIKAMLMSLLATWGSVTRKHSIDNKLAILHQADMKQHWPSFGVVFLAAFCPLLLLS